MFTNQNKDYLYLKLAFHQAEINLGSTSLNPSVGCVIVKNNSVISSGRTSFNGRPHAEANALEKKINLNGSNIYITLEPCSHYGKTPPCVNNIINKRLHKVIFSINDSDKRSKNLAYIKLKKAKINVQRFVLKNYAEKFYKSYFLQSSNSLPLIDAKLAISKDFFSINSKEKWITNFKSRRIGNFLRSKYDCLLTTSKTINDDNPLLNCRVEGLEKKSPDLIVLDRFLSIKKNSAIFNIKKRKIYILTNSSNLLKENFFKEIGVKIIKIKQLNCDSTNLKNILYEIKKLKFNRILVESGITFLDKLIKYNFIRNFYLFRSPVNLGKKGLNNSVPFYLKKIKIFEKNKIKVNLKDDSLYKVKI